VRAQQGVPYCFGALLFVFEDSFYPMITKNLRNIFSRISFMGSSWVRSKLLQLPFQPTTVYDFSVHIIEAILINNSYFQERV
jgi:hypothetical protein